jgi:hypothetical protein
MVLHGVAPGRVDVERARHEPPEGRSEAGAIMDREIDRALERRVRRRMDIGRVNVNSYSPSKSSHANSQSDYLLSDRWCFGVESVQKACLLRSASMACGQLSISISHSKIIQVNIIMIVYQLAY